MSNKKKNEKINWKKKNILFFITILDFFYFLLYSWKLFLASKHYSQQLNNLKLNNNRTDSIFFHILLFLSIFLATSHNY